MAMNEMFNMIGLRSQSKILLKIKLFLCMIQGYIHEHMNMKIYEKYKICNVQAPVGFGSWYKMPLFFFFASKYIVKWFVVKKM